MTKTYKYRIYPNRKQETILIKSIGCVRYIYNKALALKIKTYEETKKHLSYFTLCDELLKQEKTEHEWLYEVYSQNLQMALRNLDNAFTRFFHKLSKFPKFKSKHSNRQSIQYTQGVRPDWEKSKIWLPKCGFVSIVFDRKFEGKIKTCTVSKTPTNKFFISILVDDGKELPTKLSIQENTSVGIDMGIKTFATLSNGEKIENPKYLKNSLQKLKKLQRRLSRKKKGSNNRKKAVLKVALAHEKIANQRKDFLQKVSTKIVSENQTIILEDLNIAGMLKNHNLAQFISDVGWGMFNRMLEYKSEWYGKNIIYIGRFDPSSKMCSNCGNINQELELKNREWECKNCHTHHDRDVNAAINIKKFGLIKEFSGKGLPVEPAELLPIGRALKQETNIV